MNSDSATVNHTIYHHLNALVLLAIDCILLFAFYDQLFKHDLPCPMCLLQRLGLVACSIAIILNLRHGLRARHYGLFILSCVYGASMSLRQISLHVVPHESTYGNAFMGYHLYTWGFIAFSTFIFVAGIALLMPHQFVPQSQPITFKQQPAWIKFVILLTLLLLIGEAVSAFLECGFSCDPNPVRYELLSPN